MRVKAAKWGGVVLIFLVLLLVNVAVVEARTFRKAVQQSDSELGAQEVRGTGAQISNSEPQTTNYKPQTAQDSQSCEPTIKRVRGKRVVTNNCVPQASSVQPQASSSPTGFQTFSQPSPTIENSPLKYNSIIVLNTNDGKKAKEVADYIKKNGGDVSIVYLPNTLVVTKLPSNLESTIQSKYGGKIYSNGQYPTGASQMLLNTFVSVPKPAKAGQEIPAFRDEALIAPDAPSREVVPPGSSGFPPPSDPYYTSYYMLGDVFVSIILPESTGAVDPNVEDWNASEEVIVDQQYANALQWWKDRSTEYSVSYPLTFYVQRQKINIPHEPTQHQYKTEENIWINDLMDALGVAPDPSHIVRVRNYDNSLRTNSIPKTDWAYTAFVADVSTDTGLWNGRYAYVGGPFEVLTMDVIVYDWDQNYFGLTAAHETGHIFWADDQYQYAGGSCTSKWGFLQVENQNYDLNGGGTGGCLINVASIMRGLLSSYTGGNLDPYGAGQLGWRDLDSDSVTDSIDITYNTWDSDTDGDQTINYWDIDDDNDGIGDVSDACKLSAGWSSAQGCSPVNVTVNSNASSIEIGAEIRITANALDNFKVATLSIFVDGVNQSGIVCSGIGTPTANCYKVLTYGTSGSHNFYSTATDDNNLTTTGIQSFTVNPDTGSPTVTVSAPASINVGNTITITADATDNLALSEIKIIVDGSVAKTCAVSGTSANCAHTTAVYPAPGSHTYHAEVTDSSSNTGRDPIAGDKTFDVVDSANPTVSVTAPASVGVGQNIRVTATSTDNVAVSAIDIYVDGALQGGTTCSGIGTASANCYVDLNYGSVGTHTYYSIATDSSSNTARDPVAGTKSFDVVANPAPTISVTAPASVEVNNAIRITATATDNAQVSTIKIFVDSVEQTGLTCAGLGTASANCYKDLTYSALGSHTFYATATDNQGSTSRDPVSGTKSFSVVDTTKPTVLISATPNRGNIGQTIAFRADANDNLAVSAIDIYVDGIKQATACSGIGTKTASCSVDLTYPAPGTHTFYATTADSSGNTGRDPSSGEKTIDIIDNIAPTFTEPITVNSAGSSVTIIAKAADNYQLSEIKLYLDGSLVKTCPASGTSGQCDFTTSLNYGTHRTYATATDSTGNTATHPEKVFELKDNIKPVGTLSYGGSSDPSEGKRFVMTISASDDNALSNIAIYRSGAQGAVKTCSVSGKSGSCEFRSNWGYEGRNSRDYYAVVKDAAGNAATVR